MKQLVAFAPGPVLLCKPDLGILYPCSVCSDLLKLGAAYSWYRTVFDRTAWRQLFVPVRT